MEARNSGRRRSITIAKTLAVITVLIASILASSASAVPLSRSLNSMDSVIPDSSAQISGSWKLSEDEEDEEGRRLLGETTNDYGGPGANDKHLPPKT